MCRGKNFGNFSNPHTQQKKGTNVCRGNFYFFYFWFVAVGNTLNRGGSGQTHTSTKLAVIAYTFSRRKKNNEMDERVQ